MRVLAIHVANFARLITKPGGDPRTWIYAVTAVTAQTGLGRTTLYRNPTLRAVIDHHRRQTTENGMITAITDELATLRVTVDAIAARVRHHEEQLRRINNRKPT